MLIINAARSVVNFLSAPQYLVTVALLLLVVAINFRPIWTRRGGIVLGISGVLFFALSYLDPNFNKVATLPDNVPIVGMIFLVGFFFWWAMHNAYENDRRIAEGRPTIEGEDSAQKVFSWPDLVYVELICLVVVMAVMIVWSIFLKAPLEEPANPTDSPNPSKAPWYFLGLQEILVYYDPWMAGVVLPSLIIVGLMAIPYIDTNPKGNGYFTFKERRYEITIFLVGFLVLWCILIVLGTFLRGPNWNFFGPYEMWDINKLVPLNNINLSEIIWIKIFKTGMPRFWLFREIFGLGLVVLYMGLLPPILAKTVLRRFYEKMGTVRYLIGVNLALVMLALPIKMYLRWIFNLKYIVNIPEASFNI
ncbi:MAG TPA: hypothetical protein VGK70_03755 [Thermoanaerobaculia bacterium]|jgi:uncharacterized membrane protein YgdD (TMEM256/DUF423 family)